MEKGRLRDEQEFGEGREGGVGGVVREDYITVLAPTPGTGPALNNYLYWPN